MLVMLPEVLIGTTWTIDMSIKFSLMPICVHPIREGDYRTRHLLIGMESWENDSMPFESTYFISEMVSYFDKALDII